VDFWEEWKMKKRMKSRRSNIRNNNQIQLISFLCNNKNAFPHKISGVRIEETHISWVLLTGEIAYKIKKELKFGNILDFSTLNLRKKFCQKEVDINRSLCGEDMYRGVVKIIRERKREGERIQGAGIKIVDLKSKGQPLEYAVKMREIPQKFRMDTLLQKGKVSSETINKLTFILAEFHESTLTSRKIRSFGRPEFIKRKVDENFSTLSRLTTIDPKFKRKLNLFIRNKYILFFERIRDEKIRDIHGDLYLKNIFVTPDNKFYLYDRIEFNDSLRYADVSEDVAHLAMDLDFHGRSDLKKHFISKYRLQGKDENLEDIVYFWMCYKACVRVKVALFRASSLYRNNLENRKKIEQSEQEAGAHLKLAESYLELL
jgi:aminoglycoside phosphotransferase family enzyme